MAQVVDIISPDIPVFNMPWERTPETITRVANVIATILQPVLDIINLITKSKIDLGEINEKYFKGVRGFLENLSEKKIAREIIPGAETLKGAALGTLDVGKNISQNVAPIIHNIVNVNVPPTTPGNEAAQIGEVVKKTVLGIINNQVRFMTHSLPEVEQ